MDHEICVFSLSPYANVNDEVNKLNELMKKLGGSAKIITNGDYRGLVIDWDPTKLSRNAGKKRKWSKFYIYSRGFWRIFGLLGVGLV